MMERNMVYGMHAELPSPPWQLAQPTQRDEQPDKGNEATMRVIRRVLAGDVNAFNQLVITYEGLAYNVAYRVLQDRDVAADAVQESFLKAYRALPNFRGGQFKNWLLRIVTNTCYDLLREKRSRPAASLDDLPVAAENATQLLDPAERPEKYAERMELHEWIERGLRALSPEQRMVVVLCDIQGYKYEEAAQILGVPVGTVKSRLNRARVFLRDFLLEHGVLN
jgi:RNA polymerase sigma-70 factor, ECF subfamily